MQSFTTRLLSAGILILALSYCGRQEKSDAHALKNAPAVQKPDTLKTLTLAFAGDIMNHKPQIDAAWDDSLKGFDFSPNFQYVAPIIRQADIAIANLETTFGGTPYTGYPQFSAPDTLAYFLKNAGFDVLVTANNHAADRSGKGIRGTIEGLDKAGLQHTGTFLDTQQRKKEYPLLLEKNGIRLALLNYTYGTNGLPVPKPYIVNKIDTTVIAADIHKARKKLKAEAVIVVFHWGIEYQRQPNAEQKKIAGFTLRSGADVVIGSHPHVIQPAIWETYSRDSSKKHLVVYSLGNFISNQRDRYRDAGEIVFIPLQFNTHTRQLTVDSPSYVPTWVYIKPEPKAYYILPSAQFVNDSTFIPSPDDRFKLKQSLEDTRQHLVGVKEKEE
jgi:poly-gamma-glutamate synthesis protein (capsule biosynthesis protein)